MKRLLLRGAMMAFLGMTTLALGNNANANQGDLVTVVDGLQPITTETFMSTSADVEDGCITAGTHKVLRFDFHSRNAGNGVVIAGSPPAPVCSACPCGQTPTVGSFIWSDSHCHWHIKQFNNYSIVQPTDKQSAAGFKQAFCLMDYDVWNTGAGGQVYSCSNQGVSVGWEDTYTHTLPCQFINVDGVANGDYRLVATTNALPTVDEANIHNNSVSVPLHINGTAVTVINAAWQTRESITATTTAQASVASWGPNHLDVFWTDGSLHHRAKDHEAWKGGEVFTNPTGVTFTGAPASVSWGTSRIDAFARGSDGYLWHKAFDGTSWLPFEQILNSPGTASAPAVVSDRPGTYQVFWVDTTGNLMTTWSDTDRVLNIATPGAGITLLQGPRAVAPEEGTVDVIVRGSNNRLYHAWSAGDPFTWHWENPRSIATVTGRPDITSTMPGTLDVVWPNSANHSVQHMRSSGGSWGGIDAFTASGVQLDRTPSITAWSYNRFDVFVRGSDNKLHRTSWNGSTFSSDVPFSNADLTQDPIAISWASNQLSVVVPVTVSSGKGLSLGTWF